MAGRRFFSYKNRTLDFQKLESLPLIFLEKNTSSRSYMDEFLAGNGVYVQPEFELATSDMIVQFVRRNLGVGCVMRDFARDYVESGLLFELRFNKIIPKRQFCVVRNTKMPMAPVRRNCWRSWSWTDRKKRRYKSDGKKRIYRRKRNCFD